MSSPEQLKKHEINEDKNTEPTKTEYDTLTEVKPFNAEQARKNATEARAKIAEEKRIAEEQAHNRQVSQEKYQQAQQRRREEEQRRREEEKMRAEQKEIERIEREMPEVFAAAINERIKEASIKGENQVDFTYRQMEMERKTEWYSESGYFDDVVDVGEFEHKYDGFTGLELVDSLNESRKRGNNNYDRHDINIHINRPIISDVLGLPEVRDEDLSLSQWIKYTGLTAYELSRWTENDFVLNRASSTLTNLAENYAKNGFRVYLADTRIPGEEKGKIETIQKISWGEGEEPGVVREEKEPEPEVEQETSEIVKEEVTAQGKTSKRPSLRDFFKKKNNN